MHPQRIARAHGRRWGAGVNAPRGHRAQPAARQSAQRPSIVRCSMSTSKPCRRSTSSASGWTSCRASSCRRPHEPHTRCAWSARRADVELLAPARPVAVADDPEILEHVQRPVDRRRRRRRVDRAAAFDELGARDVALDVRQDVQQHPPLRRPAQATGAESRRDLRPAIRARAAITGAPCPSSRRRTATPRATAAGRRGRTGRSCRSRG